MVFRQGLHCHVVSSAGASQQAAAHHTQAAGELPSLCVQPSLQSSASWP
jgi:hypothetical protein